MKIITDTQIARSTLLRRDPIEPRQFPPALSERMKRLFGDALSPEEAVEQIIAEVKLRGDAALFDYTGKIDGVELSSLEVGREDFDSARREVEEGLMSALNLAAQRIRSFHLAQRRDSWVEGGLGQLVRPVGRAGIYVPGGTAFYPSTVLMMAVPARVAGVEEVIIATPPGKNGEVPAPTLVAAEIAGVDRVFRVGGAQAIAALAFGTESIPGVDKIYGPGGLFVTLAKKKVYGSVGIDAIYGPTETVVIADGSANPAFCAAELLAQAEHDVLASAILITTSPDIAQRVSAEVERRLAESDRREIVSQSLEGRGGIVVVKDMDEAIELSNDYAPEHLSLMVEGARSYIDRIRNAGGIFIGCPEALGDYIAGPSHVMPTGGTARFSSPLSVDDFIKVTSLVALDDESLRELGPPAATIARVEGLTAHARAIEERLKKTEEE